MLLYTLLYGPTVFFIKVSILILYLRVFSPDRRMRILIYLGMGYTLLANSIVTILYGALCAPRKGQSFLTAYTRTQCANNIEDLTLAIKVVNLVGDIYVLVLPISPISKLQLSRAKKITVIGVFMTGLLYDSCHSRKSEWRLNLCLVRVLLIWCRWLFASCMVIIMIIPIGLPD